MPEHKEFIKEDSPINIYKALNVLYGIVSFGFEYGL